MMRKRATLPPCLAVMGVAAALAVPATSSANQVTGLVIGQLTISGDQAGKTNDLITIDYDAGAGEYVIGHDVAPVPTGCLADLLHPNRVIRCPASLVSAIQIDAGEGSDKVIAVVPASVPIRASMGSGNDSFTGGDEVDTVDTGPGNDAAYTGGGNDSAEMGPGNDKMIGGDGNDRDRSGPGSDKMIGGAGNDWANLGSGSDKGIGGGGADKINGGSGPDKLFGGAGNDLLLGGGGPDSLIGGPGHRDRCNGGPGGERLTGCEAG